MEIFQEHAQNYILSLIGSVSFMAWKRMFLRNGAHVFMHQQTVRELVRDKIKNLLSHIYSHPSSLLYFIFFSLISNKGLI